MNPSIISKSTHPLSNVTRKNSRTFTTGVAVLGAIALSGTPAFAALSTIANYTFDTGAEGWEGRNGSSVTGGTVDTAFGNSPVLEIKSATPTRAFVTFSETTIANVGDYIQVDFNMRVAVDFGSNTRRFEVALYDLSELDGYGGRMTLNGSESNFLYEDADVPTSGVLTGSAETDLGAINLGTVTTLGKSQTYIHSFSLQLFKTAAGVDVLMYGDDADGNAQFLTASDTTTPYTIFDTLDISSWGGADANFNIDSVKITKFTAVPEPSSFILTFLGMGWIGLRRRR